LAGLFSRRRTPLPEPDSETSRPHPESPTDFGFDFMEPAAEEKIPKGKDVDSRAETGPESAPRMAEDSEDSGFELEETLDDKEEAGSGSVTKDIRPQPASGKSRPDEVASETEDSSRQEPEEDLFADIELAWDPLEFGDSPGGSASHASKEMPPPGQPLPDLPATGTSPKDDFGADGLPPLPNVPEPLEGTLDQPFVTEGEESFDFALEWDLEESSPEVVEKKKGDSKIPE